MRSFDVCIIGGGLLGTATAYFAARGGLKVVLLEAKDLASGASGAAFGGVSVGIYSYSSARVPPAYVALSKASLALYRQLQDDLGPPLDLDAPGSIDPFYSEEGAARGRERVKGLQSCGVACEFLTQAEVKKIEPAVSEAISGAIYCPVDAHVTPPCVVWALAKAARQHGAEIRTRSPASSILRTGDRAVGVETERGPILSEWVVDTAGIAAAEIAATAGVNVPLDFSRGQMFVTERIPPLLKTYVHNIKQTPSGTIVFGATRESGITETSTTVAGTREILAWAVRLIPALSGVNLLRSWAGIRPVPPDGYPIIGPVPGVARLLIAAMHRGVTLAPVVGQILADLILRGRTDHDIAPYLLSRFDAAAKLGSAQEAFYAQ